MGIVAAISYYGLVVAGEIGRSGSIVVSAVPAALVLIWFRGRPTVAMILAAVGVLLVAFLMTNGYYVQAVTQQCAVLFAIFGGALSRQAGERRAAVALSVLTAILVVAFAYSRYGGMDGATTQGAVFGLSLLLLVFGALGLGAVTRWLLARDRRLSRDLHESAQRGRAAERDVLLEIERNRIAREVHDVVAHSLAVVIAQADGARFAADRAPGTVAPALDAIAETARRALGEVRTMLHDLQASGEGSRAPGSADLEGLLDGVRGLDLEVDFAVFGTPRDLDGDAGLALYRVAQEALTNAVRHGDRGQPVRFELDWGERQVVLAVTNALSTTAIPAGERAGRGLEGMRSRAQDVGGDCTAGIGSNDCFRVRIALPLPPVVDAATDLAPVRTQGAALLVPRSAHA